MIMIIVVAITLSKQILERSSHTLKRASIHLGPIITSLLQRCFTIPRNLRQKKRDFKAFVVSSFKAEMKASYTYWKRAKTKCLKKQKKRTMSFRISKVNCCYDVLPLDSIVCFVLCFLCFLRYFCLLFHGVHLVIFRPLSLYIGPWRPAKARQRLVISNRNSYKQIIAAAYSSTKIQHKTPSGGWSTHNSYGILVISSAWFYFIFGKKQQLKQVFLKSSSTFPGFRMKKHTIKRLTARSS